MKNKITLITYGDDAYKQQRQRFKVSAIESGFFHKVEVFTPENIENEFKNKFDHILRRPRGGGYWIWKPYVVRAALREASAEDIIIYADAGCLINKYGGKKFKEYIDIVLSCKTGSLAFGSNHQEAKYTNRKVLEHFGAEDALKTTDQLMATAFLLRKNDFTEMLVDKWYNTLFEDEELFTDAYNSEPQDSRFVDHRHDQSIFSLVRKIEGSTIIPKDETYFNDFTNEGQLFPIWATRYKG